MLSPDDRLTGNAELQRIIGIGERRMHEVEQERLISLLPEPLSHELEELALGIAYDKRLACCGA